MRITDKDVKKIAKAIEDERITRKSLVSSWMDGAFTSKELHEHLNRGRQP